MQPNLVIFDMDGTILDTLTDLQISLNTALTASGLPTRTLQEVRNFVGNGIPKLIERGVPQGTAAEVLAHVTADFTAYYADHCYDNTRPYEGIVSVIEELRQKGYRTAVVSNKDDYAVQILADRFFSGLFDAAVGSKEGVARKPAPDSVFEVLHLLSADAKEAIYIGDSEVDVATARNSGLACIAVLWGFRSQETLEANGATRFAKEPEDLLALLA